MNFSAVLNSSGGRARVLGLIRQAVSMYRRFTVVFSNRTFEAPVMVRRWKV